MAIASMRSIVLDCPDPQALARFYGALLDWKQIDADDQWVTLSDGGTVRICFQRATDYQPPRWPDPGHPQQLHIDVTVTDVETAEVEVLALGATKADTQPAEPDDQFRVFLDPAGHPFCLCWD